MIYYLVGIKGCAMCALANLLKKEGHIVKGADVKEDFYTKPKLYDFAIDELDNIKINEGYFYIIGNAFKDSIYCEGILQKCRYLYYPEFIKEHFKYHKQICIAGSHGKTTTTALIAHMLGDCNYLVGDGSGGYSKNDILVIEACEYKNTFLNYNPYISLVLNIDYDHPDFFKNEKDYINAFKRFIDISTTAIVNGDDKNLQAIDHNSISFGMNLKSNFSFQIKNIVNKLHIFIDNEELVFNHMGRHYAYDVVGAYVVARQLKVSNENIRKRLRSFRMPNRRMSKYYQNKLTFICDYAHHPTEIEGVYQALRLEYPNKRLVCFFEPHTYSRTISLEKGFKRALSCFDETYLYRTFNSRENKNEELDKSIIKSLGYEELSEGSITSYQFDENEIYVFLGAGTIDNILRKILYEKKWKS